MFIQIQLHFCSQCYCSHLVLEENGILIRIPTNWYEMQLSLVLYRCAMCMCMIWHHLIADLEVLILASHLKLRERRYYTSIQFRKCDIFICGRNISYQHSLYAYINFNDEQNAFNIQRTEYFRLSKNVDVTYMEWMTYFMYAKTVAPSLLSSISYTKVDHFIFMSYLNHLFSVHCTFSIRNERFDDKTDIIWNRIERYRLRQSKRICNVLAAGISAIILMMTFSFYRSIIACKIFVLFWNHLWECDKHLCMEVVGLFTTPIITYLDVI